MEITFKVLAVGGHINLERTTLTGQYRCVIDGEERTLSNPDVRELFRQGTVQRMPKLLSFRTGELRAVKGSDLYEFLKHHPNNIKSDLFKKTYFPHLSEEEEVYEDMIQPGLLVFKEVDVDGEIAREALLAAKEAEAIMLIATKVGVQKGGGIEYVEGGKERADLVFYAKYARSPNSAAEAYLYLHTLAKGDPKKLIASLEDNSTAMTVDTKISKWLAAGIVSRGADGTYMYGAENIGDHTALSGRILSTGDAEKAFVAALDQEADAKLPDAPTKKTKATRG